MKHLAIMNPSWGMLDKIINYEKIIESRWLMNRSSPWDKVFPGDFIYFKQTGQPIQVMAQAAKVEQYADLNSRVVTRLLEQYRERLGIDSADLPHFLSSDLNGNDKWS